MMATILTADELKLKLTSLEQKYNEGRGRKALLQEQLKDKQSEHNKAASNIELWGKVQMLLNESSQAARERIKTRIEQTVTAALQAIKYDEDLRFKVDVDSKGGRTVAEWRIVSPYGNEVIENNPEDADGGGIVDIVSLALRLSLLELAEPKSEGLFVADEPSKHLSQKYPHEFAAFIREYLHKTGRQGLIVTHDDALTEAADKVYMVEKDKDGNSEVTEL